MRVELSLAYQCYSTLVMQPRQDIQTKTHVSTARHQHVVTFVYTHSGKLCLGVKPSELM